MPAQAIQIELTDPPSMTPKQASIVGAAAKLFLDRGYGAVSMDAIAAEASASKRTVYSYYHNKETLFADVMSLVCADSGGRQGCPLEAEELVASLPPREVLQKTGEHVLGIISAPQAIEMYRVVVAEAGRFPELGKAYYEGGPEWMIDRLKEYLDKLVQSGDAKIDDTQCASRKFFGLVVFPIQMEMMLDVVDSLSEKQVTKITEAAVDVFCPAYCIGPSPCADELHR